MTADFWPSTKLAPRLLIPERTFVHSAEYGGSKPKVDGKICHMFQLVMFAATEPKWTAILRESLTASSCKIVIFETMINPTGDVGAGFDLAPCRGVPYKTHTQMRWRRADRAAASGWVAYEE